MAERTAAPGSRALPAAAAGIVLMLSLGTLYAWSVFVEPLERHFERDRSDVSLVFSLSTLTFTIGVLVGPWLYRRIGAPGSALVVYGLAMLGLGLSAMLWRLEVVAFGFGGLFGLAGGIGYGLSLQAVNLALPGRRGVMTGVVVAAYTVGAAGAAPILKSVIDRVSLSAAFAALALGMAVAGGVAWFLLRRAGVDFRRAAASTEEPPPNADLLPLLHIWACFFCGSFVGVLVLGHAAPMASAFAGTADQAAFAVVLVTVGNGVGRLLGGPLANRFSARAVLLAAAGWNGLALMLPLAAPGIETLQMMVFAIGLGYGSTASALPIIVVRRHGAANLGRIYGRIFTAWGVAGLLGPFAGGVLFDAAADYRGAIAAALAATAAAGAFAWLIAEPAQRSM